MEYFLIKPNGEQTGTYSIEQVRAMLAAGYIDHDTRYWHEGIDGWQPIDRIEESLQFVPPPPPPAKTVPPKKLAAVLKAVPPPATKLEKPDGLESKPRTPVGPSIPTPTRPVSAFVDEELPAREESTFVPPVAPQRLPAPLPESSRLVERLLYFALGAVLMLAVLRGPSAVHYISDKFADKITLTETSNFVLLDVATIKSFNRDMQSSPTVESLKARIAQTTDPVSLDRLKIGMENEISRHEDEVRQQYLRANSAQTIDAGTYRIRAYYDDQGHATTARKDQAQWVAISYREHTVYALRPTNSPPPQQPSP
jgi:hypothetical protein